MGRPRRNTDPSKLHLITIRTQGAQLLMRPDPEVEEIIGSVVAKYQQIHNISLFAYCFLSNHYHLLVQALDENLWLFEQEINREIAKRTNSHLGRSGVFWNRRYDDQTVLEVEDATQAMLYLVTNPVHHCLVHHPKDWPGLNSYHQLLSEKPRTYRFTNYTEYNKAKRRARRQGKRVDIKDFQTSYELKLSPLPEYESLSKEERTREISRRIEEYNQELIEEARAEKRKFLGRKRILTQSPFATPRSVACSPRPPCYTKNPEARRIFVEEQKSFDIHYTCASIEFRAGKYDCEFPPHCLKPPMHYVPVEQ